VNVPIGIALAIVAPRVLAATPGRDGRLDLPGALTATGGMVLLVYGLSHAASYGWTDTVTLMSLGLAALLLLAFVAIEFRNEHALMPFNIFAQRNRNGAYVLSLVIGVAVFGVFFFLTQFVQNILGFSPLVAGVAFLPLTAAIIITAQIVARLVGRFGPRPFITIGPLFVAAGLFWLSQINDQTTYLTGLLGPMLLIAVGMGNIFVPLTLMAVAGTTPQESGLASALLNVGQQIGGSIGIALLGTVAATTTKNQLVGVLPTRTVLNHALTAGYGSGFLLAFAIALVGFAVAMAVFRTPRLPRTAMVAEEAA
jgi:predicted MFS family arabinose efflux permease